MFNVAVVSAASRLGASWPWYVTRASGLIAAVLLVLLMITGISVFTGHEFKFMEPIKAWTNHRTLGIAFSIAVGVHILSLLFDKYITFNVVQVFVPFTSQYKHTKIFGLSVGSLGVTLGIVSLYMVTAIVLTSLTAIMSGSPRLWKWTHLLSYLVITAIFFHSIMIGTDLHKGVWRWTWIGLNLIIIGFIVLRLRRTGSLE